MNYMTKYSFIIEKVTDISNLFNENEDVGGIYLDKLADNGFDSIMLAIDDDESYDELLNLIKENLEVKIEFLLSKNNF